MQARLRGSKGLLTLFKKLFNYYLIITYTPGASTVATLTRTHGRSSGG